MPTARHAVDHDGIFLHVPGSALILALLADKWTIPVIHALARGTKRTGELLKELGGVSQKMLTQTLRRLEDHALVERRVYAVVPPRVEYSLTQMGRSINEPLARLCAWTEQHGAALEQARTRQASLRHAAAPAAGGPAPRARRARSSSRTDETTSAQSVSRSASMLATASAPSTGRAGDAGSQSTLGAVGGSAAE
jgi:DNA-binding HxlR family transcriptional regulator